MQDEARVRAGTRPMADLLLAGALMNNATRIVRPIDKAIAAKAAGPIDKAIAARVRHFRELRGMTQGELADMIGISTQMMSKYEIGTNRISCGRIACIAHALGIDVSRFFAGTGVPAGKEATDE